MTESSYAKDYVLDIRVKNGPLLRAMHAAGFYTVASLCHEHDLSQQDVGRMLSLSVSARTTKGDWRLAVMRVADAIHMLPEDLFPPQHQHAPLRKNRAFIGVDLSDMEQLSAARNVVDDRIDAEALVHQKEALAGLAEHLVDILTEREQFTIKHRFGLGDSEFMTLDEVAASFGVTRERIRQVEATALRKLGGKASRRKMAGRLGIRTRDRVRKHRYLKEIDR